MKIRQNIAHYLDIPPFEYLLLLSIPFVIFKFKTHEGLMNNVWRLEEALYIGASVLFIHLLYQLLLSFFKRSGIRVLLLNLVILTFYYGLYVFHYRTKSSLDLAIIIENFSLWRDAESWKLIWSIPTPKDIRKYVWLVTVISLINIRWDWFKRISRVSWSWKLRSVYLVTLLLMLQFTPAFYDEFGILAQRTFRYIFPRKSLIPDYTPEEFITLSATRAITVLKHTPLSIKEHRPNIFIIFMESFNANFVNHKNEHGKEYTPFFNQLIKQGIYFSNFYGNSMQTTKGHFATLCSRYPLIKGKIAVDHPDIKLKCLPEFLRDLGYETIFTQGYSNINFDNTYYFMTHHGFNIVFGMDRKFISSEERHKFYWGWGIQDDLYYKKVFSYLDSHKQHKKPLFVTLATISNHMRFSDTPKKQRYLYPDQQNRKQKYANTLRVSDEYLKAFFSELHKRSYLKNSIILILGDHSFPAGEHGSYDSQNGFYNEYFKTPLLILGPNIKPLVVHHNRSQVDIAPTLLSALNQHVLTNFVGHNLFDQQQYSIYLVQPYAGKYLAVVDRDSKKYVYRLFSQSEYLYDLKSDPQEVHDIFSSLGKKQVNYYRSLLKPYNINCDFLLKK